MTMRIGGADEAEVEERPNDFTGLALVVVAIVLLGMLASWNLAFIVVAIIFMIFMHEMGHFLTAKLTGMKVTEFFIGFGPRIWSFEKGETEYGIKMIPAGAYVRIIGMNNLDPTEPGDEHRAYRVKSFPRKLLVVSAGSLMHFAMAFLLVFAFIAWQGVADDNGEWTIGSVSDQSAAAALELEIGDEILSVDGIEVDDFQQFGQIVQARGAQEVEVVYQSDGETITESVVLGGRLTDAGQEAIVGLEFKDRILAIDGVEVFSWADVTAAVGDRIGEPIPVIFDSATLGEVRVVDDAVFNEILPASVATEGFFGVSGEARRDSLNLFEAGSRSIGEFGSFFTTITSGMWETLTGGALPTFVSDTLSGDIDSVHDDITSTNAEERELASRALEDGNPDDERIISIYGAARVGSQISENGLESVLIFMAGLNISVGLLNMLPLPPLDGGHVVVATYERMRSWGGRRYEVDYNKVLPLTYFVFAVLTLFGLIAIFRDIIDPINVG